MLGIQLRQRLECASQTLGAPFVRYLPMEQWAGEKVTHLVFLALLILAASWFRPSRNVKKTCYFLRPLRELERERGGFSLVNRDSNTEL
jgi:hypothetical protein